MGDLAEEAFDSESPSALNTFIVRMVDPWRVRPAGSLLMDRLDSSNNFPPEAWQDARDEWRADRAAATMAAEANLTSALAGFPSCTLQDVVTPLPFAVIECSNADAEALWNAGTVRCLNLDIRPDVVEDAETGRQVRNGHGAAPFLPNNRVPNSNTATTGYGDASGFESVILEQWIPSDLGHPGFTWDGTLSKLRPSEGCSKVGLRTRCTVGRASSLIHSTPDRPHAWSTLTGLVGSVELGQDAAHPSGVFDPANRGALEDDSTLARGMSSRILALENRHSAFAAAVGRASDLGVDLINYSGGGLPTGLPSHCAGQGVDEFTVDDAVDGGMQFFKSAGNEDQASKPGNAFACNLTRPAGAIGAFTVAALQGVGTGTVGRWGGSSHADPSGRRTLVDMGGAGDIDWNYSLTGGVVRYNTVTATSVAAPIVGSAAMVYVDHYEGLGATYIRQPLVLYTRLLLYGNGVGQTGVEDGDPPARIRTGYHHSWGAGKLHLKPVFLPDGGSGIRASRAGEVCVSFTYGENVVEIDLPEPTSAGGSVTAVARFHNADFSEDGSLDEIEMRLVKVTTPGWMNIISEDKSHEEKLRVSGRISAGETLKLQFIGRDFDGAVDDDCGVNERRVVFAYKWVP